MDEELPDDFDVIIVGTGLTESIISGALSRIGKKVLHLDYMRNYGSDWSSFNLKAFEERMTESTEPSLHEMTNSDRPECVDADEEIFIPITNIRQTVYDGSTTCHIRERKEADIVVEDLAGKDGMNAPSCGADIHCATGDSTLEESSSNKESSKDDDHSGDEKVQNAPDQDIGEVENSPENSSPTKRTVETVDKKGKEYFYSKWRHFNLDLTPKLMFSRGKLVELLIVSNVCRYLEFRNVTGTLTLMDESEPSLVPVPCSRTDIFNSKLVTMVEKRLLMRILMTCANYENHPDEYKDFEDRPFIEFLAAKKLSKRLKHFIIHSIAMVSEDANTLDGLKASEKFLKSLGRYGNSAFLWTTYGVGELPQAFCRLGAVFGGTFCLNRFIRGIVLSKTSNQCIAIVDSTGQRLKCDNLILNEMYAPDLCRVEFASRLFRAIYVTDSPFADKGNGNSNACLISIPPTLGIPPTWLIEVSSSSCVCPSEMYVVHAMMRTSCSEEGSPKSRFSKMEDLLFDQSGGDNANQDQENDEGQERVNTKKIKKPKILWSSYFSMANNGFESSTLPPNVSIVKGPCFELGFDETVMEARVLFESICPNEEFLPRAPNPEEIIYFDQNDEGYNTENNGTDNQTTDESPGEYQEVDDEVDSVAAEVPEETIEN